MDQSLVNRVLSIPRAGKRMIALAVDALLCVATVFLAYYLRLGVWIVPVGTQWISVAAALLFALPLFITFGFYRAIFRYVGWAALAAVLRAGVIYALAYSTVFTLIGVAGVPRTIGIIQPILLFGCIGASRAGVRFWLGGGYETLRRMGELPRVLIYGAGAAGRQLAAAIANGQDMIVVAFVDDDPTLHKGVINGKTIYPPDDLPTLFARLGITDLLLAVPSASRRRRQEILEAIRKTPIHIRTLPGLMDLARGRIAVADLRELDIEDLLGRDSVMPNPLLLTKNIAGRVVMVTGAGGSIGGELCRQILALRPETLLLVEMSEFALYEIHQELERERKTMDGRRPDITPLLASVCDEDRMSRLMEEHRPATVYHAAAYKHVPLVESNPVEGVRNNVFGTLRTARAAVATGVSDFVLISTDKAVRPTSVMGASKRLAEMSLQALASTQETTRFAMVRFGNVLGSSGSVVPLFRRQIKAGGPVTITHAEMTRYFMTVPEAAQLVIQAGAMAEGGEVFLLDMGDPVKIVDLARNMIDLSGLTVQDAENPDGDISIVVTGLRPGEKLYEELLIGDNPSPTSHPRIMKASESYIPMKVLKGELIKLEAALEADDRERVLGALNRLIVGYKPSIPVAA